MIVVLSAHGCCENMKVVINRSVDGTEIQYKYISMVVEMKDI